MRVTRGVLIALAVMAAPVAAHEEAEPWPTLALSVPIGARWRLGTDAVERVAVDLGRSSQFAGRGIVSYAASRRLTLSAGFAVVDTQIEARPNTVEHRPFEQLVWDTGGRPGLRVALRTRLEQRLLPGVPGISWRVRQQVRFSLPIVRGGPSAVVWAEPFIGLNHTVGRNTLEQLRSFAGVSMPVTRQATVEVGYLSQDLFLAGRNTHNDVVPMILSLRF